MTITITAFERSPDGGKGLARDTRVRWALEEAGQPYEVRPVSFRAMKEPRASGAASLRPDPDLRGRRSRPVRDRLDRPSYRRSAMRACCRMMPMRGRARSPGCSPRVNTVEPPILEFVTAKFLEGDKPWAGERLPLVMERVRDRLKQLVRAPRRCRLARRCVQRGRPDDGVGAAQAEIVGHSGRVSEPRRLSRPRRSAARVPARVRRATGRQHPQADGRLTDSVTAAWPTGGNARSSTPVRAWR